jgi:hypothetical protein
MSASLDAEPIEGAPRGRGIKLAVAGVLVVSASLGLLLNRTSARPGFAGLIEPQRVQASSEPLGTDGIQPVASIRLVDSTPPEDPFQPVKTELYRGRRAVPAPPMGRLPEGMTLPAVDARAWAGQAGDTETPRAEPAAPSPAPAQAAAENPEAPEIEDLALTGIIEGDPPLAVVQYAGQSLFLKIGDQVADTWRLVEINERSARFQLGEQRVEIPIRGGSSE